MRLRLFVITTLIALTLVACGGSAEPTATVVPPTPEAVVTVELTLDGTFTSSQLPNGTLTFQYPSAWTIVESANGVAVYSNPAVEERLLSGMDNGDVAILLSVQESSQDLVEYVKELSAGTGLSQDEVVATTINGKSAAQISGAGEASQILIATINFDGTYVTVEANTNPTELEQFQNALNVLFATVNYTKK
jgi:predicted Zn-dependent protease